MALIDNQYVRVLIARQNHTRNIFVWAIIVLLLLWPFAMELMDEAGLVTNTVIASAAFVGLVYCAINLALRKPFDELGMISLYPDHLLIQKENDEIELPVTSIRKIDFFYKGYNKEPYFALLNLHSRGGLGNRLTITTSHNVLYYEIFISNRLKRNIIDRLLEHYKSAGVEVSIRESIL